MLNSKQYRCRLCGSVVRADRRQRLLLGVADFLAVGLLFSLVPHTWGFWTAVGPVCAPVILCDAIASYWWVRFDKTGMHSALRKAKADDAIR